jgi:hypothetical protein
MQSNPNGSPKWKIHRLSSLNHPNIIEELAGRKPPIPGAVSLGQVKTWVKDWTTPVDREEDRQADDIEWPPGSGKYHRPGPTFRARVEGKRPTSGIDTVWSELAWERACTPRFDPEELWASKYKIKIGVDPAAYGDDDTAIHVRLGPLSLHHESRNGWGPDKTAGRLKELCRHYAAWYNSLQVSSWDRPQVDATDIEVTIEGDGGYGTGVYSHCQEFQNWHLVSAGSASTLVDVNGRKLYKNKRSELWFIAAEAAMGYQMDLSQLDPETRDKLRIQLLSPYYEVQSDGSRMVEVKADLKERLGRSPDDADCLNICYSPFASPWAVSIITREEHSGI